MTAPPCASTGSTRSPSPTRVGAFNATVKDIVKGCGYGVARTAGSVSPTGPTYAETLPPNDWYADRPTRRRARYASRT